MLLRNFTEDDADILQAYRYTNCSVDEVRAMISEWSTKVIDNKYFEMFAIIYDEQLVGMISIYQHSEHIIGCGPVIFEGYKKQGFGYQAVQLALDIAESKGYEIASAQIKSDNAASIALHKKLGFETNFYPYKNKKGNDVYIFLKKLK